MIEPTLLDYLPLWTFFLVVLGLMLGAGEFGHRFGCYHGKKKTNTEKEGPTATIAGATVGLLAFLLAFTFGLAASRHDQRREVFQEEVNAIATTYLRAGFLPGDHGPKVRSLLRTYVDTRLEVDQPNAAINEVIRKSESIQKDLWAEAVQGCKESSDILALFVESLNRVIVCTPNESLRLRGLVGSARSVVALGLIVCFAAVMVLIADLDRPLAGMIRVNPLALINLRATIDEN